MPLLTWRETLPSDASQVGQSPAEIRQHMVAVATGLGTQLQWPGSGGGSSLSAGHFWPGASRPFFDVESNSSVSNDPVQRHHLFLASDTSRLLKYGVSNSVVNMRLVGTPRLVEHATLPTASNGIWVSSSGSTTVSFSNEAIRQVTIYYSPVGASNNTTVIFSSAPVISVSVSNYSFIPALISVSASSFIVELDAVQSDNTTMSFALSWLASGQTTGAQ